MLTVIQGSFLKQTRSLAQEGIEALAEADSEWAYAGEGPLSGQWKMF